MKHKTIFFGFSISFILILNACSGVKIKGIDLVGKDFQFTPQTIYVNLGDTVLLNFSNPDVVPHLIDLPAFETHIGLVPGGEYTLEFVADKPGTFPFVCSVPGHQEAGMTGELVVDPIE